MIMSSDECHGIWWVEIVSGSGLVPSDHTLLETMLTWSMSSYGVNKPQWSEAVWNESHSVSNHRQLLLFYFNNLFLQDNPKAPHCYCPCEGNPLVIRKVWIYKDTLTYPRYSSIPLARCISIWSLKISAVFLSYSTLSWEGLQNRHLWHFENVF